jgi:N utilization substance protein B
MLYQWEVGRDPISDVVLTFWTHGPSASQSVPDELRTFASTLANGVAGTVEAIDPMIAEAAENWRIERMNVLDRLILRLAIYEFLHQPETPVKVIINEALELARTFSTDDSVRFINGILDAVRKTLQRE